MTKRFLYSARVMSIHTTDPARDLVISGDVGEVRRAWDRFAAIPVDWDLLDDARPVAPRKQNTIIEPKTLKGPGTFLCGEQRTVTLRPSEEEGWWFNQVDLAGRLPVRVSVHNVWRTGGVVSNIVLRSGPPENYIRMVEHIIALKLGTDIDNLIIEMDSGDPPLFDSGSLDLVQALEGAGTREVSDPVEYVTVKEPVTVGGDGGSFLSLAPCDPERPMLTIDCAVDFKTAIGKQRIRFPLTRKNFRYGAEARTNSSASKKLYCHTLGKIFADLRNLGYTEKNVLIAGRKRYLNEPRLVHDGKSLEAVWHRAVLDLVAALALIDRGRFVGHVTSYKAGHTLDVEMVRRLYQMDALERVGI